MSTKTLRKRIALVAVSALGFGMISAAPSNAADVYTSALSLQTTSLTVVASAANSSNAGLFYVDTLGAAGTSLALNAGESITVSVVGKPTRADGTTTAVGDLTIGGAVRGTIGASFTAPSGGSAAAATSYQIPNSAAATAFASSALNTTSTAAAKSARYYFGVYPNAAAALDQASTHYVSACLMQIHSQQTTQ